MDGLPVTMIMQAHRYSVAAHLLSDLSPPAVVADMADNAALIGLR